MIGSFCYAYFIDSLHSASSFEIRRFVKKIVDR